LHKKDFGDFWAGEKGLEFLTIKLKSFAIKFKETTTNFFKREFSFPISPHAKQEPLRKGHTKMGQHRKAISFVREGQCKDI